MSAPGLASLSHASARFDRWFDGCGELRGPCLFRVFAGPLTIAHLLPFARELLQGRYYRDSFYVPWFAHYPDAPRWLYGVLIWLGMLSAAAMSIGLWSRVTTRLTFAIVAYNFFASETFFHHNRNFLLVFLAGLSLIDSGASVSVDALRRQRRGVAAALVPLWPLWLWRTEACIPYLASSTSKLLDRDWWAGTVTWDRALRYQHIGARYFPQTLMEIATDPHFHALFAKLVIALELTIGLGLWLPRTRYLCVWLACLFHGMIQVSAEIQVFSVLGISGLLIWTTPRTRERVLSLRDDTTSGRRLQRLVAWLDWLVRFEVRRVHGSGPAIALRERDGTEYTGARALVRVLSRLPLTAPAALPLTGWR